MATGTIRYWAAARAAAGHAEEGFEGETLGEVIRAVTAGRTEQLARVLAHCTFLVDGVRAAPDTVLPEGAEIEVLPPFAGG